MKKYLQKTAYVASAFMMILSVTLMGFASTAAAAQMTTRKVTIGSSVPSASTTYTFSFVLPTTGTVVKSFDAAICTTASGACVTTGNASGFSSAGSGTLPSQPANLGDAAGWTSDVSVTTKLRVTKTTDAAFPTGTTTVSFQNVVNPSATNATVFFRLTTYSDAAWTTAVDTGVVAASTAGQITVTASVDEALTFTLASATVALGALTTATTGSGTSTMTASTNGTTGYAISVNGATLTSGSNTITALAANTASTQNSSQFGINLMANTTPSVGTAKSGSGSGLPAANYNTADSFRFVTGETVASASAATNSNTYTVSYIANVPGSQAAGAYSTALTYIATATF
jgi:hypothetical protein